jgi:hypothetical protein
MEIDEISLVDKGANQHAVVTIAKRAPEEDEMPSMYYEDGSPVDENTLEDGDIVFDDEGNAYQYDVSAEVEEEEKELATVGKSAFFDQAKNTGEPSWAEKVREELSKAYTDTERDEVLSKAFGRIDELEASQRKAEEIAKSERDLRLTREYIAKAADYNLPVDPQDLGPVLYRMAESMSYEDCSVIAKCLESAGQMLFDEIGYQGGGDNVDIMSQVEAFADQGVSKSEGFSKSAAIAGVFDENPQAYDEYLSAQRTRF